MIPFSCSRGGPAKVTGAKGIRAASGRMERPGASPCFSNVEALLSSMFFKENQRTKVYGKTQ